MTYSQSSAGDWRRLEARFNHDDREEDSPPPGLRARVNSEDIKYAGGHFPSDAERKDLDPRDLDTCPEDAEGQYNGSQQSPCPHSKFPSHGGTPSSSSHPTTPNAPDHTRYLHSEAYLSLDAYRRWRSNDRRNTSRYSRSSGYRTDSSGEYRTARGSPASVTTMDGDGSGRDNDRATTPYFTPSHTPSHRSLATNDNDDEVQKSATGSWRARDTTSPFSPYYQHQLEDTKMAIDAYDKTIHG